MISADIKEALLVVRRGEILLRYESAVLDLEQGDKAEVARLTATCTPVAFEPKPAATGCNDFRFIARCAEARLYLAADRTGTGRSICTGCLILK